MLFCLGGILIVFKSEKQMREDAIRMHTHRETKEKKFTKGAAFIFPSLIRRQRIPSDISIIENSRYKIREIIY